jgi:hypothetical protein
VLTKLTVPTAAEPAARVTPMRESSPERSNLRLPSPSARPQNQFLEDLRGHIEAAVDEELAGTAWTARHCPWLEYWFSYYHARSPEQLQAALRKYVGSRYDASSPEEAIELVVARVRSAVARWRTSGEIDAPPAAIPDDVNVLASLGPGRPLESSVRSRMESAMGVSLATTRIHTDEIGARAASSEGAHAFAVGDHIAFGAEQYRPGTLEGDALIAHELAHTIQQRGATRVAGPQPETALEHAADGVAVGSLGRLWSAMKTALRAPFVRPALGQSGLRLQRCSDKKEAAPAPTPAPAPAPAPAPPPAPGPPWIKPTVSVTMTGHDVVQGSPMPSVQPTDVAGEMVYERFALRDAFAVGGVTHSADTVVRPTAWDNLSSTVPVVLDATPAVSFVVPKWNLRPLPSPGRGVALYQAGKVSAADQAKTVKRREAELATWDAEKPKYKTNAAYWTKERADRETALKGSEAGLNVLLIQQLMFNRFDEMIVRQVDAANAKWGGKDPLDANIVKSIIFRESQMGTSGAFLDDTSPRNHEVMNHWNLTQAIDSFGEVYANYIVTEKPALAAAHSITNILTEEKKAWRDFERLGKNTSRNAAEETEYLRLKGLLIVNGKRTSEPFFRTFPGFADALRALWATTSPPLNNTYEHWIEMLIVELFRKRKISSSWPEAVERYNGINPSYRKAVMDRVKAAKEAAGKGIWYIPSHGD